MIEVEKKFQPTEDALEAFLVDAEFLGDTENRDVYYDLADFSYSKKGIKLRNRNQEYELKIPTSNLTDYTNPNYEEITNESEILERLGFSRDLNLEQVIKEKMEILCSIKTKRKKYKKEGFNIDVDETDYGYKMVEIEYIVESESEIKEAEKRIEELGKSLDPSGKKLPGKVAECLRITRPEVYENIRLSTTINL